MIRFASKCVGVRPLDGHPQSDNWFVSSENPVKTVENPVKTVSYTIVNILFDGTGNGFQWIINQI